MSADTNLPGNIDVFDNNADNVDVVMADDVNKLQNAMVALEDATLFTGTGMVYSVADVNNTSLVDGTSLKISIENIDTTVASYKTDLTAHKNSVAIEHNAIAVAVAPGFSFLDSLNVQSALEELQGDINTIVLAGVVNNVLLSTVYVAFTTGTTDVVIPGALQLNGELTAGAHYLNPTDVETGVFGMKVVAASSGQVFGTAVNFRYPKRSVPALAAITLNVSLNVNAGGIAVVETTEFGFFFHFNSVTTGTAEVRGTYTIIG